MNRLARHDSHGNLCMNNNDFSVSALMQPFIAHYIIDAKQGGRLIREKKHRVSWVLHTALILLHAARWIKVLLLKRNRVPVVPSSRQPGIIHCSRLTPVFTINPCLSMTAWYWKRPACHTTLLLLIWRIELCNCSFWAPGCWILLTTVVYSLFLMFQTHPDSLSLGDPWLDEVKLCELRPLPHRFVE